MQCDFTKTFIGIGITIYSLLFIVVSHIFSQFSSEMWGYCYVLVNYSGFNIIRVRDLADIIISKRNL